MDLGSIFLGVALALVVAAYLLQPVLTHSGTRVRAQDRRIFELQAELDRVLNSIQELDMDFTMAKILEEDYRAERLQLVAQGAKVLRELDALGVNETPPADLDQEIEAAVRRLRGKQEAGDFCPLCGEPVLAEDRFCMHCGAALQKSEATT